jgi:outer membrane protein OmpA-like peptidoglycan-associated protein
LDQRPFSAAVVLATGIFVTASASAQTLTDTEIAARFAAQRAAIRDVETNPALGPSRGLVLTNIETAAPAPGVAVEAPAPPGAATAGAPLVLLPTTDDGAATTPGGLATSVAAEGPPATPVSAHWTLPKEDEVNVQVTFAFDSAVLADSQKSLLRTVCSGYDKAGVDVLRIVGHTDAAGPARYNQNLSVLRAEEVKRFFVSDCGIAADRLQAVGVGEQFPFDTDPLSGTNRRVEFQAIS